MTSPVTPLPLTIELPLVWCHLSLDPERDAVEVPAQVDALIAYQPDLAPARQALLDMFFGWADSARGLEAGMAAMRYGEDPTFGVAMATLLIFRLAREAGQPIEAELAALRTGFSAAQPNDQYPPHLQEVDTAVGRSLRVDAVRDPTSDPADPQALRFVLQHWVPLPDHGYTLEFEATTSNLAMAPDIAAEVDAIVASVTLQAS